jgi:hypothetical protein
MLSKRNYALRCYAHVNKPTKFKRLIQFYEKYTYFYYSELNFFERENCENVDRKILILEKGSKACSILINLYIYILLVISGNYIR